MREIPDILQREIGENEDALLDDIWQHLPDIEGNTVSSPHHYKDLQQRIRQKQSLRRQRLMLISGGMAAVLLACVWLFQPAKPTLSHDSITLLHELGVTVASNKVTLKTSGRLIASLDGKASIEDSCAEGVNLQTPDGSCYSLANESLLLLDVPAGQQFHITLSDGTQVWLNAASSLEYPASFEGRTERRVKLTGEAFFDVARDEKCPFYVETEAESICVLGTSFNVNAYPQSDTYTTTLVSGRISYKQRKAEKELILSPHQQVNLCRSTGKTSVNQVNANDFIIWREGQLYFEDEKLPELADRLSRLYGIDIQVDKRLSDYAFSGKLSFERGIEYITRLISETTDIRCEVENGVIQLKK